jgi:hypothetical protein
MGFGSSGSGVKLAFVKLTSDVTNTADNSSAKMSVNANGFSFINVTPLVP